MYQQINPVGRAVRRALGVIGFTTLGVISVYSQSVSESRPVIPNLSPSSMMVLQQRGAAEKAQYAKAFILEKASGKVVVNGIAKVDLATIRQSELLAIGVSIGSQIDDIWTLSVPLESLEKLSALSGVVYFEADMPIRPKLDTAAILVKANRKLFNAISLSGYNGKNVVVGVVDGGFDYTHPSFEDSLGQSRILSVWDQNVSGTPPNGFGYGAELTSSNQIKNAHTDTPYGTHGTHVLSIAAAGTAAAPFVGIAPKSDIILVAYKGPSTEEEYMSTSLSGVLDGVKYIFDKASQLGKPAVVNLSLGFHMGPHDGTSLFDQACDKLVGEGRILVGAAGNEGMRKLHLGLNFTANDTLYRTFVGLGGWGATSVDSWGEVNKNYCIQLSLFNKVTGTDIARTDRICTSDNQFYGTVLKGTEGYNASISIYASSAAAVNRRPRITIYANNPTGASLRMVVTSPSRDKHQVNFWNDAYGDASNFNNMGLAGYAEGNVSTSVGEIGGTGKRIISVGAYTSKNTYRNLSNSRIEVSYFTRVGLIAPFSSRGPTVDGRIKPEITAPGNGVVAALNSFCTGYNVNSTNAVKALTHQGRSYIFGLMQGTSMASPMVTGAVALLLQQNPKLTPEEVKLLLAKGAIRDPQTGLMDRTTDNIWGAGKLSAIGALSAQAGKDLLAEKNKRTIGIDCRQVNSTSDGVIDVVCKESGRFNLSVADLSGRVLYNGFIEDHKIVDLSPFGNGLYFIKVYGISTNGKCKVAVVR